MAKWCCPKAEGLPCLSFGSGLCCRLGRVIGRGRAAFRMAPGRPPWLKGRTFVAGGVGAIGEGSGSPVVGGFRSERSGGGSIRRGSTKSPFVGESQKEQRGWSSSIGPSFPLIFQPKEAIQRLSGRFLACRRARGLPGERSSGRPGGLERGRLFIGGSLVF